MKNDEKRQNFKRKKENYEAQIEKKKVKEKRGKIKKRNFVEKWHKNREKIVGKGLK